MGQQKIRSRKLSELCEHMSQWRKKGGGRGTRIPEELWHEALEVARLEGTYATARAARLNYDRLKERSRVAAPTQVPAAAGAENLRDQGVRARTKKQALVAGRDGSGRIGPADAGAPGGARFVALQVPPSLPARHSTIELWGHNGDRMRVEVEGALDVAGLAQTFWCRLS